MSRIYTKQTYLRIALSAGEDVTSALETKIFILKPDGTLDSVDATVSNATTGDMYYDVEADSSGTIEDFLDQPGWWKFWTYVMFVDGREARGSAITRWVFDDESD